MKSRVFTVSMLVVLVALLLPATVAAGSLSIQPLRQELELKPGQSLSSQINVTNTSDSAITVHMNAESFGIVNENYDYSFSNSEEAKNWVNFGEPTADIKPNDSHTFNYSIGIPNSAEPGEKYIAIFASVDSSPADNISLINRVGELSYITVAGNVTKRGKVLDLSFPQITFSHQISWSMRLQNTGSAHFRSSVSTSVKTIFGHTISQKTDEHLVLPNTVRHLDGNLELSKWPGLYKVAFLAGSGDDPAFQQTKWVVYMPFWAIVVLVLAGISTVELIVKIKRKRSKKYVNR